MELLVKDLMSSNVYFVHADASVSQASALMKKYDIGLIPVCDNNGILLGLLTDRDIVLRAMQSGMPSPLALKVSEIMSETAVTVSSEVNIHDAACIFSKGKMHRLPVVENSRLVGILSLSDLAKKRIFLAEVGEIMGSIASVADKKHQI